MLGGSPHFSKPNFKNSSRLALLWQKMAVDELSEADETWLDKNI